MKARTLGIPFEGNTGKYNAITDVPGVMVGHETIIEGDGDWVPGKGPIRTGVTMVLPRGRDNDPVMAGWFTLNGNGEMTGTTWIEESGYLEGPIGITNTLSVGTVHQAIVEYQMGKLSGSGEPVWALPVSAETYDGILNDITGLHVKTKHAHAALDNATDGEVAQGNVGGGTGMICHMFKGGSGTASQIVEIDGETYTLGVIVQANYGSREALRIAGVPVGQEITDLMPQINLQPKMQGSSIIVVVATDAPLLPHQLKRIAKRASLGIGRMGGYGANSSGDIFVAFSTANPKSEEGKVVTSAEFLVNAQVTPLFQATTLATEEAIVNCIVSAETMTGINGNTVHALPHDRLLDVMRKYNRLNE